MCWDVAKPVTVLDILGMVGEDHGWGMRFQSSGRWQEARWSCCELPTWACGLAWECNNPSSKCKDGPHTFLWTNGSAVPVDILMNLVNPAHSLVVVFDQEWLANVHPFPIISTIIWFLDLVYRHQPCWRQRWRHCYRSTSQRLVHSLCHMQSETHLMVPFPFLLLKSRVVSWLTGGDLM